MRITKKQVVEALRTEPLKTGRWIRMEDNECNVCAVGAVLRSVGIKDEDVNDVAETAIFRTAEYWKFDDLTVDNTATKENIEYYIKKRKWLHALSAKFESMVNKDTPDSNLGYFSEGKEPSASERKTLIRWVNRNFPKYFIVKDMENYFNGEYK